MRPGLHIGASAAIHTTVRQDMVATFDELGPVHPVYATWNLVRHMEEASRKVILPYLDDDEDAVGHSVEVVHLSPTLVGRPVVVTAHVSAIEDRRITCNVVAHSHPQGQPADHAALIGRGRTVQIVVEKAWLAARLAALGQPATESPAPPPQDAPQHKA
ncbi:MAG: thioesterase [Anaerolineae bacterium]